MEVEEAIGHRDIPQAEDRESPGYPNHKVDAMAVQNATGSLEIMGQLVLNEWELLRHRIREFGVKIRQMSSKVAAVTVKRLWNQLLSLLRRHSSSIPKQFELDAELLLSEMEKIEVERPPPRDTLADIRRVLLEDVADEGIVVKRAAPAWRAMPPKRRGGGESPSGDGESSVYQLFNRPMTVPDDDFDRFSGPSTNFAQSESEKILSLEAQLSLLTRQLNTIMTNGGMMGAGGGGGESQRASRSVSRSHSRASLHQSQQINASMHGSYGALPALSYPHQQHHQQQSHHRQHGHPRHSPHSLLGSSDDDGSVYMHEDSASSYTSPSHTTIPLPPPLPQSFTVAGRREAIPPAPPLQPFLLQAPPLGRHQSVGSGMNQLAESPTPSTLVPYNETEEEGSGDLSFSPPCTPLPPPPPMQQLQQLQQRAAASAGSLQQANTQESALSSSAGGRSFLDDINKGNFNLRKTSSEKSPSSSLRSSTSGEETEHDENTVGPLVKPTTKQLLTRKDSLRRVSTDRSPGGTPLNRNRRRMPSLGQDGGRTLFKGDYLAAALAKQFNTIHVNEEDDDQSVTAGDQSWLDD